MTQQPNSANGQSGYQPGELLRRRKGPVMHTGVSLGDGRVLHNTPGRGEHVSTLEEFAKGKTIRVSPGAADARARIQTLDEDDLQRPYNLFVNNCEHTASRVTAGQPSSPQLKKIAVEALIGAALLLLLRRPLLAFGARLGSRVVRKLAKALRN